MGGVRHVSSWGLTALPNAPTQRRAAPSLPPALLRVCLPGPLPSSTSPRRPRRVSSSRAEIGGGRGGRSGLPLIFLSIGDYYWLAEKSASRSTSGQTERLGGERVPLPLPRGRCTARPQVRQPPPGPGHEGVVKGTDGRHVSDGAELTTVRLLLGQAGRTGAYQPQPAASFFAFIPWLLI